MSSLTLPLNDRIAAFMTPGRRASARNGLDDAALVRELLRTGDDNFFEPLVQRYKGPLLKLIASILGPRASAESEDLVQDVFVIAYRKLDTFRHDGSFSAWLFRIARNTAYGHFRKARQNYHHVSDDELQSMPGSQPFCDPEAAVVAADRHSALLQQVQRLSDSQRTVIHLFYWNGCSYAEISGMLDMSVQTVKSHLYRARQQLATKLAATEDDL